MRAWAKAHQIVVDTQEGTKTGQTGASPSVDAPKPADAVKVKQMALCAVCGASEEEHTLRTYIARDGVEWTICTFCTRLAKAQRNLKILGLWKPVKREDIKEAGQ
jgi:hypothetical protein